MQANKKTRARTHAEHRSETGANGRTARGR